MTYIISNNHVTHIILLKYLRFQIVHECRDHVYGEDLTYSI